MKTQVLFGVSLVRTADTSAARSEGPVSALSTYMCMVQQLGHFTRLKMSRTAHCGRL